MIASNTIRFPGLVCGLLALSAIAARETRASDWPQILGPHRNGVAVDETLKSSWATGEPTRVWEESVGSGFAGIVISQGIAVLFHREGSSDTLTGFDAKTGRKIWSRPFPTSFMPQIVDDDGPRATPTIAADRVYALAAGGGLYCVALKSGDVIWERQTQKDFRPPQSYFGAGSSPLVEGKTVVVNVGGDKLNAGIVAFDTETGSTVWKSTSDQASYSSPVAATIDGTRLLLCLTRLNFIGLDPASGQERFRTPFGKRGPTVNGANPVVIKNQVLLTASYEIGAELVAISDADAAVTWSDSILSSQYATPIFHDGVVYGVDGRQDGGPVSLKCFDPFTRKEFWSQPLTGYATLISADGKLLVMQTNGILRLVALSKTDYRELSKSTLLSGTCRALPALSDGRLYVRNESRLKCVTVGR